MFLHTGICATTGSNGPPLPTLKARLQLGFAYYAYKPYVPSVGSMHGVVPQEQSRLESLRHSKRLCITLPYHPFLFPNTRLRERLFSESSSIASVLLSLLPALVNASARYSNETPLQVSYNSTSKPKSRASISSNQNDGNSEHLWGPTWGMSS